MALQFYFVSIPLAQGHPHWDDWFQRVVELDNGHIDSWANNHRVIRSGMSKTDLEQYLRMGAKPEAAEDLVIQKITRWTAVRRHSFCLGAIQRKWGVWGALRVKDES